MYKPVPYGDKLAWVSGVSLNFPVLSDEFATVSLPCTPLALAGRLALLSDGSVVRVNPTAGPRGSQRAFAACTVLRDTGAHDLVAFADRFALLRDSGLLMLAVDGTAVGSVPLPARPLRLLPNTVGVRVASVLLDDGTLREIDLRSLCVHAVRHSGVRDVAVAGQVLVLALDGSVVVVDRARGVPQRTDIDASEVWAACPTLRVPGGERAPCSVFARTPDGLAVWGSNSNAALGCGRLPVISEPRLVHGPFDRLIAGAGFTLLNDGSDLFAAGDLEGASLLPADGQAGAEMSVEHATLRLDPDGDLFGYRTIRRVHQFVRVEPRFTQVPLRFVRGRRLFGSRDGFALSRVPERSEMDTVEALVSSGMSLSDAVCVSRTVLA